MAHMDLTEGSIGKKLAAYAAPVVFSSVLQSAYAVADLLIAGWFIGKAGISGINNSGQITLILTQIIMGISVGGNILMGQFFGSREHDKRCRVGQTLFSFGIVAGFITMILLWIFCIPILKAIGAPALGQAASYLRICAAGTIPIFCYNALSAILRAAGDSRHPLRCVEVTVVCNIILDYLTMGPLNLGVRGAAFSTVFSQTVSCLLCLYFVMKREDLYQLRISLKIERQTILEILKVGIPSAVQMTIVGLSWLAMTVMINRYGVEASAASGICAKIKDIVLMFTLAMYSASTTMVAQCLGAGKFDRASKTVHTAMRISILVSVCLILITEITAPMLLNLFHPDAGTMAIGIQNLRIEIIGQIFYASFMVYNSLPMGAGNTMFALASSTLNCVVVRVVLALILDHFFGLPGIFIACALAPASSVPLGYIYEKKANWRRIPSGIGRKEEEEHA